MIENIISGHTEKPFAGHIQFLQSFGELDNVLSILKLEFFKKKQLKLSPTFSKSSWMYSDFSLFFFKFYILVLHSRLVYSF